MPRKDFKQTFQTGLGIGANLFQLRERERIDIEKQQAKDREKRRIENEKTDALNRALGVDMNDPAEFDPLTKQPKRKAGQVQQGITQDVIPSGVEDSFDVGSGIEQLEPKEEIAQVKPSPLETALTRQTLSPEGKQIYDKFLKETFPNISDTFFGIKEQKHPDRKGGGLYGFNKETGEKELIQELPNYIPKPITGGSYIIYGTADLQGENIGIKGRRTRVVELDDGTYKLSDLGVIPRGSKGTDKEKTQLEFEISMADYQNSADGLANRKQQYLTKDFSDVGGETSREDYRTGYNSAMSELALRVVKLGSPEAQSEALRIWNQGQTMIRGGGLTGAISGTDMTREDYFDAMKDEVLSNMKPSGDWDYKDAQSIIKFLEFKYDRYLSKADSDVDEDLLENFEMDNEGNIIEKGNK